MPVSSKASGRTMLLSHQVKSIKRLYMIRSKKHDKSTDTFNLARPKHEKISIDLLKQTIHSRNRCSKERERTG